jgi:gluconate kinase
MPKDLLQSQLDSMEEPDTGLTVDIAGTPEEICRTIADNLLS